MKYICYYESPFGTITLASDGEAITGLWFEGQKYYGAGLDANPQEKELPIFEETKEWLDFYFNGRDPGFCPKLKVNETSFRKEVWDILLTIPYGKTMTYGEIAKILAEKRGLKKMSAQAIGGAVAHNPISLLIPCHRVVGADGSLTGYAGGVELKEKLLNKEKSSIIQI